MLVASLHQGIADLMPARLDFYENWLHPAGMRNGKIGLAALAAVLSFLRQEGDPYALVTARAGEYAAQWTFDGLTSFERSAILGLPAGFRARMALRLARRVVRRSYRGGRAVSMLRKGEGTVTIRGSVFCDVREPGARPLCEYYAAAVVRLFDLVGVEGAARVFTCRGAGDAACVIAVSLAPLQK